jgi:hypothetical protein
MPLPPVDAATVIACSLLSDRDGKGVKVVAGDSAGDVPSDVEIGSAGVAD